MNSSTVPFGYTIAAAASVAFSIAVSWNNGAYHDAAIFFVFIGVIALVFRYAVALRGDPTVGNSESTSAAGLLWVALMAMLWVAWMDKGLVMYARRPFTLGNEAILALMALVTSYLPWAIARRVEPPMVSRVRFALIALAVVVAGIETLRVSPEPRIDVWTVQMGGAQALLAGKNAYTAVLVENTAPGSNGITDVPYVYPPMQLYLSALGYLVAKDVRATMFACIVGAGIALRLIAWRSARSLPSLLLDGPALLIWCMPKLFFILEQAWTDPVQVFWLCAGIAAFTWSRPVLAATLLGVGVASKQTMFWVVPMAIVMLRLPRRAWLGLVLPGALSFVPFLGIIPRLKYSLFDFQNMLPPRSDGLTFKTLLERHGQKLPAPGPAFLAAAAVCVSALVRLRGSVAHFGASLALLFALFFSLNKWAFANYYFLIGSLCALAAATALHAPTDVQRAAERRRAL